MNEQVMTEKEKEQAYNTMNDLRLEKVETNQEALTENVIQIAKSMSSMTTNVNHLVGQVESLTADVKGITNKKFDWSTLIAGLILILGLWAAAIKPIDSDITELKESQSQVIRELIDSAEFMGKSIAYAEADRKEIDQLKIDLLSTLKTRFTNSDGERLRQEVYDRLMVLEERVYTHQTPINSEKH